MATPKNNSRRSSVILFIALILLAPRLYSQADFSGSWKRNDNKTNAEEVGLSLDAIPATLGIFQNKDSMAIKRTLKKGIEQSDFTDQLKFDGSITVGVTPSKLMRSASIIWASDKKQFTYVTISKDDLGNIKQSSKQTVSLVDGGKSLKMLAELHFDENVFQVEEIFDKQ